MKKLRVAVLGAGRLADVLVRLLSGAKTADLRVWARRPEACREFAASHPGIDVSDDIGRVASPAEVVFFAVPASAIEEVADRFGPHARGDQIVVHATRGVAEKFVLPHQAIRAKCCVRKIVALGGPLHGRDLASGRVMAAAVASRFDEGVFAMRVLCAGTPVRVHPSRDVIGVEVAGAISNVTAIAAGMADTLELGETARGVILTRGLVEAQRLGVALGGEPATFVGLAGVGDLIPRKVTSTERHQKVGAALAAGQSLSAALEAAGGLVEGVLTARAAMDVAASLKLKLPLLQGIDAVLRGELPPRDALEAVLHIDLDDLSLAMGKGARREA